MCDTSRKITPSAAYAIRKSQIYNVTICNTTCVGGQSGFCPIPGCPCSLSRKFAKQTARARHRAQPRTQSGKQIANRNCFWPVNQTMADKLLRASKRIIRYVALYSMAGVAMESRLFRIPPNARDTPFMDACAAFLTPKMNFSQVMRSGCNLRRVAHPPETYPQ